MAKMTLIEAIKHCEEKAEELREQAGFDTDNERYRMSESEKAACLKCAEEHEQLAEWLKELKAYKDAEAEKEAADEARREAMELDDNEDSLKWRFTH
jgi:hypothetical protein